MKILTVDDVAELLHLNRVTIYRMAKAGEIPAIKVGRVWRFPEQSIEAWLAEKITAAGARRDGGKTPP